VLLHDLNDPEGTRRAWQDLTNMNPFSKAPNRQPIMKRYEAVNKGAVRGKE
jgi:hypothetical protein